MLDAALVEQLLCRLSEGEVDRHCNISCQGIVKHRRRHENATFLMLETDGVTVQIVVAEPKSADTRLLQIPVGLGCWIWCSGNPACDRAGSLSLYATDMQLVKIPPDVKQIAKVLEAVIETHLAKNEAAQLLHCDQERISRLCGLQKDQTEEYKRELRQQVFSLTGGKEVDGKVAPPPSTRQRKAKVSKFDLFLLDGLEQRVKDLGYEPPSDTWIPQGLAYSPCTSDKIPDAESARGPLSRSEYFHGKKWPQISWLLGRLEASREAGNTFAHVLDVGGGRGDLAIHIASAFGVKVTVVDTNESSLQAGRDAAAQNLELLSFRNMDFSAAEELPADIDLVVALHACGGLSDAALNFAVSRQIGFMICPCCHFKHQHLEPKHGWASLCDLEARSLSGEICPMAVGHGEANQILRRLAELDRRDISWRALYVIAALRLRTIMQRPLQGGKRMVCKVATFAEEYSLRNLVLIGDILT